MHSGKGSQECSLRGVGGICGKLPSCVLFVGGMCQLQSLLLLYCISGFLIKQTNLTEKKQELCIYIHMSIHIYIYICIDTTSWGVHRFTLGSEAWRFPPNWDQWDPPMNLPGLYSSWDPIGQKRQIMRMCEVSFLRVPWLGLSYSKGGSTYPLFISLGFRGFQPTLYGVYTPFGERGMNISRPFGSFAQGVCKRGMYKNPWI